MSIINISELETQIKKHKAYVELKKQEIIKLNNDTFKQTKKYFKDGTRKTKIEPWFAWIEKDNVGVEKYLKQFEIDYVKLIKIAHTLNEKYYYITSILNNEVSITYFDPFSQEMKYVNIDKELECIDELISMNRDAILLIIKSVNTKIPKPCANDPCQQEPITDIKHIANPPTFNFGNVTWNEGQAKPSGKYRYIPNFEIKKALTKIIDQLNESQRNKEQYSSITRESTFYYNILTKAINQTRSVNISRLCIVILLLFKNIPDGNLTLHHCKMEENPGIYYLQLLFKNYISWPFLDGTTEMYYPNDLSMSTQLPVLTYSILTKSMAYCFGVITVGYFNLCMNTFIEWSKTSLDDEHLLQKGNMNKMQKLLFEKVSNSTILQFGASGIVGILHLDQVVEFWLDDEKENLVKMIDETKSTRPYFNQIKKLLDGSMMERDKLILHLMALESCTNNGTFKKTSPAMEYDRSAAHKVHVPVSQPHPEMMYEGFPIKNRFEGVLLDIWNKLMEKKSTIAQNLKNVDFEAEFYDRLTNNKGGITKEQIQDARSKNKFLKGFNSIPYGQRFITALVDNEALYNEIEALNAITSRVSAGKRDQIDRRVRWIMMVLNALQAVFSLALSVGKQQHKLNDFVASGKQVGNIADMLFVLTNSSNPKTIITDNDIKGMDSSTQEQIVQLILSFVFEVLSEVSYEKYFFASEADIDCKVYDKNGFQTSTQTVHINALQHYIIKIIGSMRSNSFNFSDTWFNSSVNIPGSVFWSGAFHTAAQHNMFLSTLLEVLAVEVKTSLIERATSITAQVLGDDISVGIHSNINDKHSENDAKKIIKR